MFQATRLQPPNETCATDIAAFTKGSAPLVHKAHLTTLDGFARISLETQCLRKILRSQMLLSSIQALIHCGTEKIYTRKLLLESAWRCIHLKIWKRPRTARIPRGIRGKIEIDVTIRGHEQGGVHHLHLM